MKNFRWLFLIGASAVVFYGVFFAVQGRYFSGGGEEIADLKRENLELKARLEQAESLLKENAETKKISELFPGYFFRFAKAYSSYPFNVKNRIVISAGRQSGLETGMAVLDSAGSLIGEVSEVSEKSSMVKTIFDAGWQTAVRIGERETNGVLVGGLEPRITLILGKESAKTGDAVASADAAFPYGLFLGEVGEIKGSSDGVFREAVLKTRSDISSLKEVFIITSSK